jgi:hypothetical protein
MATKAEEKKAFEKLRKADIPGDEHKDRSLQIRYTTYSEHNPEYKAYISGFNLHFLGLANAYSPMEAVDTCIAKAKEVVNDLSESS